jgi:proline dehydrogenase
VAIARKLLLAAADSVWLRERAMRTAFVKRSVSRFMPGERVEDALAAATAQQQQGVGAILTRLGENLTQPAEAADVTSHYLDVLDRAAASGLDAHISIKPTQLGLDLDEELCRRHLRRLVDRGRELQRFVWIDMESARYVDATLRLFTEMRRASPLVGLAIQAYLYRTEHDLDALLPLGVALRLVKGAYLESARVAYPKKADVDESYYRLAVRILGEHGRSGALLHIATHDAALVRRLAAYIEAQAVPASYYEYAMLYGIQEPLRRQLVAAGKRTRVLISYGEHWFPWYMRRLAERPANVSFVMKNLLLPDRRTFE